ncbi:MAG: hypothetical protein LAP40_23630 [Acidobacteriia bacterium]|nr:hypothetical protein [Terriglobia bacterium]
MSLAPGLASAADKLTVEDRIELTRGLMAEYATAKVLLPRSKKPLEFNADGTWDKKKWEEAAKVGGPAGRSGDLVQITKIDIDEDKIVLEINHGMKGGSKWYQHIQIGMGGATAPVSQGDTTAPNGTSIAVLFHKPVEPIKAAEIKKMLAPVLDFEKRSATEIYADTLPPEVKKAIQEKRVTVGMDRNQVMLALGRPQHKSREVKDGVETEDWVFGDPPGKITFVTFDADKVIKVKEDYAGLGTEVADPKVPR